MTEPPEEQAVPEQASSSSELAAVDFMSSDEELDQAAAACDGRYDSSDDDATPQAVISQRAELRDHAMVPVSKQGRAPEDSRFGSPEDELRPIPADVQSADHGAVLVNQWHDVDAGMVGDNTEDTRRGNSQQSDAKAESSGPESADEEHESAPAADDTQLGGLQSSGEARLHAQIDGLSGTSASNDAETEGHEDANLDDIGKGEPSRANASLPQSEEEGQEVCAEEACAQHEGQPSVGQQPSAAAHRERHACDNTDVDAEQLREQHEQQVLQGRIFNILDILKPHW